MTKTTRSGISRVVESGRPMVERALRHEVRVPVRYRREGQERWTQAEAINMSSSGLLFASNELLEIDTRVEITFHTSDSTMLDRSTRFATVVRRVLNNWPETELKFGAKFCM